MFFKDFKNWVLQIIHSFLKCLSYILSKVWPMSIYSNHWYIHNRTSPLNLDILVTMNSNKNILPSHQTKSFKPCPYANLVYVKIVWHVANHNFHYPRHLQNKKPLRFYDTRIKPEPPSTHVAFPCGFLNPFTYQTFPSLKLLEPQERYTSYILSSSHPFFTQAYPVTMMTPFTSISFLL